MGYKGRHRSPTPLAKKLRIPALLLAMVTPGLALFQGGAPEATDPPVPPVEITLPTMPVVPTTATPVPTTTPAPTTEPPPPPTTTTPPPATKKKETLDFPESGPSYGGVKPHVRRVGWLVDSLFPVDSIGGVGSRSRVSDHPKGLALDFMVHSKSQGDPIATFLLEHQKELKVKYVIWRQRINHGDGWSKMADRGSITENHFNHVHVSFYA